MQNCGSGDLRTQELIHTFPSYYKEGCKLVPKSTRNRSPEAKQAQLDEIIDQAMILFDEERMNFSMQELARRSGLGSASSLYRYISSKKEVWDLICARDFQQFGEGLQKVVKVNENPATVVKEMGRFFIDFAIDDFTRLERMFLTPPPPDLTDDHSNQKTEPDEDRPSSLEMLITAVRDALDDQGVDEDPILVAHYLWALVLGSSILMYPSSQGIPAPYLGSMKQAEEFKNFVLDKSERLYTQKNQ